MIHSIDIIDLPEFRTKMMTVSRASIHDVESLYDENSRDDFLTWWEEYVKSGGFDEIIEVVCGKKDIHPGDFVRIIHEHFVGDEGLFVYDGSILKK